MEGIDYDVFLNGIDYDDEKTHADDFDDGMDEWHYFMKILQIIESMKEKNQLPSDVQYIHEFWEKSFWPSLAE